MSRQEFICSEPLAACFTTPQCSQSCVYLVINADKSFLFSICRRLKYVCTDHCLNLFVEFFKKSLWFVPFFFFFRPLPYSRLTKLQPASFLQLIIINNYLQQPRFNNNPRKKQQRKTLSDRLAEKPVHCCLLGNVFGTDPCDRCLGNRAKFGRIILNLKNCISVDSL